jgi:hypothetical protein
MKTLKLCFGHPVKGVLRLLNKVNPQQKHILNLDTMSDDSTEIPLEDLPSGKWKAFLEWEHNGRDYFYEKEFEIE